MRGAAVIAGAPPLLPLLRSGRGSGRRRCAPTRPGWSPSGSRTARRGARTARTGRPRRRRRRPQRDPGAAGRGRGGRPRTDRAALPVAPLWRGGSPRGGAGRRAPTPLPATRPRRRAPRRGGRVCCTWRVRASAAGWPTRTSRAPRVTCRPASRPRHAAGRRGRARARPARGERRSHRVRPAARVRRGAHVPHRPARAARPRPGPLVDRPRQPRLSRSACQAYFHDCEARDRDPGAPYFPKLEQYAELFAELYDGLDGLVFDGAQPWTLFAVPDLQVVIAGLNSTMAESHRPEDDYGRIGEAQAAWFAERLRPFEEYGWLRLGVVRHDPLPGRRRADDPAMLRDAATLRPAARRPAQPAAARAGARRDERRARSAPAARAARSRRPAAASSSI